MHEFRPRRARRDRGARHKSMSYANNQIKPSVVKSLRGYRGYRGYRGAAGANGATGLNGTTGFTSTLPSGSTEVGTWAADVGAATSSPY